MIFFDNNSTTPIDPRVFDAMLPYLKDNFANPSSLHYFGTSVNEAVKHSRNLIAEFIGAEPSEIIFTSGSTEAINIALKGVAEAYSSKGKHIVTVTTEHLAVLDTCKDLESRGFEVTYLSVNKDGFIDLTELKSSLRKDTILVCVMYVNNETGVIQQIREISSIAHEYGVLFMTDGTQAVGKLEINVDDLGVDLLCMSGHKIYAPKGIGALFVRQLGNRVKLATFIHGGGHEYGVRSGTLNVAGIVALAKACEISKQQMKQDTVNISSLRDKLENALLRISGTYVNGSRMNRIYNVSNICFPGVDANVLIGRMKYVAVSNGSACTAAVEKPSHVLQAMKISNEDAFASIRFSLGRFNSQSEVESVINTINQLLRPFN